MQSDSQSDFAMDFDVVIPVHNRIAPLQRAIQSVLKQDLAASRVIVVDDASTIDLSEVGEWAMKEGCRWKRLEKMWDLRKPATGALKKVRVAGSSSLIPTTTGRAEN